MRGALARSEKGRKRGENHERQSNKRDAACGGKQQSHRARKLKTRGQEAPASGVAPALEVGFRVANIEEVDEPRASERQSRDDVHNERGVHRAAPRCIGTSSAKRPASWLFIMSANRRARSTGLRMTDLRS